MPARKSGEVLQGLKRKGFNLSERHHHFLVLYDEKGRLTHIRVKVSHSRVKEYGPSLLNALKHQLHLDSIQEVLDLIDCPMSKKEYLDKLKRKGILR